MAEVIKIVTEIMFGNHLYTFGGNIFKQRKGGPIGLRGTCAIARLTMCSWDRVWKKLMVTNRVQLEEYMRYMDDGRSVLHAFKKGWRWHEGRLCYSRRWQLEDKDKSGLEVTETILGRSMQDIYPFLKFTTEVGEGVEGWLPTLDTQLRVEDNNVVSYRFYEKPSTTNTMVPKRSALTENSKLQILSNDLVRRLSHTDIRQDKKTLSQVIDQFGRKVLTSGYSLHQARKIAINGIRGWDRKKDRMLRDSGRLFRTSRESLKVRTKKKLIGKTTWYRGKKTTDSKKEDRILQEDSEEGTNQGGKNGRGIKKDNTLEGRKDLKTAAVLFVDNTKDSELARAMREVIGRLENILGYKVKIVERSGTPLKLMFPLSKIGEGQQCGRLDCITCTQDNRGETVPPCRKRSVLYENICTSCNPDVLEDPDNKKKKFIPSKDPPSVYIGETSRSLYERGKEHWKSFKTRAEDSHILKHQELHHGGQGEPKFLLRPIKFLTTALTRQLSEAVRIQRLGEDVVLNSRGEYNRCTIGRLTLNEDNKKKDNVNIEKDNKKKKQAEDNIQRWEKDKALWRRAQEVGQTINLEIGLVRTPGRKRTEYAEEDNITTPSSGDRTGEDTWKKENRICRGGQHHHALFWKEK